MLIESKLSQFKGDMHSQIERHRNSDVDRRDSSFHLISDDVTEVITSKPTWIIENGNFLLLLSLALFMCLALFFPYPDVIKCDVKLVAFNAPKLLTATTDGKLQRLLVENGQEVVDRQPLAFLQSTGNHEQVLLLREWLNDVIPLIEKEGIQILRARPLPMPAELGELQPAFQEFHDVLRETLQVFPGGFYQQKKSEFERDLESLREMQLSVERQLGLLNQDLQLQEIEYNAQRLLADSNVIAPLEFNQAKSKLIAKRQALEQMHSQIISGEMSKHGKNINLMELEKYILDQQQRCFSSLLQLKSAVDSWVLEHVVVAPVTGMVLFVSFLEENQLLRQDQELFYIQPEQSDYYAQGSLSQIRMGKIQVGKQVLIDVQSFPRHEYGYLTGYVKYISSIPSAADSYLIKINLPNGLVTNYDKEILFRNNLNGHAEIVIEENVLFHTLWNSLKAGMAYHGVK